MAYPYEFLDTSDFERYAGFPLNTEIAQWFNNFMLLPIALSPLSIFGGVLITRLYQGQPALKLAVQKYASSQYISYTFQCLLERDPKAMLVHVLSTCSGQLTEELDAIVQSQLADARRGSEVPWSLRLGYLAAYFDVAFLSLSGTRSYTLPLAATPARELLVVPLMCWGTTTAVFASSTGQVAITEGLMDALADAAAMERLASRGGRSEHEDGLVSSFLYQWPVAENSCDALVSQLDDSGKECVRQVGGLKRLLTCSTCGERAGTRLGCGHFACSQCVFQDEDWNMNSAVVSPCCSRGVTVREIRAILTEETFDTKVRGLRSFQYGLCVGCGMLAGQGQWRSVECDHDVCFWCLVSAVHTKAALCDLCQTYPSEDLIQSVEEQQIKCSNCEQLKKLVKFPKFRCSDHAVCFDCFDISTVCPMCSRELTPEEQPFIENSFFTCQLCTELINRKHLLRGGVCGCRVCIMCFDSKMKETLTISSCFLCGAGYPEKTVDQHYKRFRGMVEDIEIKCLPSIILRRTIKRSPCEICESLDHSEKVRLPCEHIMHTFCLTHHLAAQRLKSSRPSCPICSTKIDLKIASDAGRALFAGGKTCVKCGGNLTKVDDQTVKCEPENTVYCKKCGGERGENHSVADCLTAVQFFVVDTMRKHAVKDPSCQCRDEHCTVCKHVAQCPSCKVPHFKVHGRKDVLCTVCKTHFCHYCSAPYEPIIHHGELWHRPQCVFSTRNSTGNAAEVIENTPKADDCKYCQKVAGRCETPGDLEVRGRFA